MTIDRLFKVGQNKHLVFGVRVRHSKDATAVSLTLYWFHHPMIGNNNITRRYVS